MPSDAAGIDDICRRMHTHGCGTKRNLRGVAATNRKNAALSPNEESLTTWPRVAQNLWPTLTLACNQWMLSASAVVETLAQ